MRRSGSPTVDLLAVFTLVFGAQQVAAFLGYSIGWVALSAPMARPWTLVTSIYAHAGLTHLLANAIALAIVGFALERFTSRIRMHLFVLLTGAIAGLTQYAVGALLGQPTAVLGASGAILALYGYAITGNRIIGGILSRLTLSRRTTVVLLLLLAGGVTVFTAGPGVALIAHFTGFAMGLVSGRVNLLRV